MSATLYGNLQAQIEAALGQAAQQVGQPFTAYRCDSNSNGDFPSGWTQIATGQSVFKSRTTGQKIESALMSAGTMFFDLVGDMRAFLLGDVFVNSDAAYVAGVSYGPGATSLAGSLEFDGFGLAWHPPVHVPVGARIDRRVQIYRTAGGPLQDIAGLLKFIPSHDADLPLVLAGGVYAWGAPGGTASWVPAGFASTERPTRGPQMAPALPDTPDMLRYYAYLPPLAGYAAQEGDAIFTEDGARYEVQHGYRQEAGVVGSQIVVQRRNMPLGS